LTPKIGGMLRILSEEETEEMVTRSKYDKSFKEEAVKLAKETSVNKAARSLGLHENTLRNWVKSTTERADNPFIGSGRKYIPAQEAEKAALIKEVRELRRANEILKEALGFFAASQKK
jgi:transposase